MDLGALQSNPTLGWLVAGAIAFGIVVVASAAHRRPSERDPRRMFNAKERTAGFQRAQNQCEFARWVFFRCTRTASHGDHFIPWTKGGATSMRNFVASCPTCNTTKGAAMPSASAQRLMAARRTRYFPSGIPRDAGERFGMSR